MIGFPSAGQPTGLSSLPFLIFLVSSGNFALCGGRLSGFAPENPTSLLKKAGPKTYFYQRCGIYPTGTPTRRRAACRTATETQCEEISRGGMGAAYRRWGTP